jgi:hypothetical protein
VNVNCKEHEVQIAMSKRDLEKNNCQQNLSSDEVDAKLGINDGQAIRLVFFQNEMSIVWPPELSGMSRGFFFHFGLLRMPNKDYSAPEGF